MVRVSQREQVRRRFKALRANAGLSQREIAAQTRISDSRYWRIENGYEQPTDAEQARLAKALKVDVSELGFSPSKDKVGAVA